MDFSEEELYQNYQEKALHNDSDEDADSRQPKPDTGIVVQYKPIRTSWSQLSVVSPNTREYKELCFYTHIRHIVYTQCCGILECQRSEECCQIQFGCSPHPSSHCLCLPPVPSSSIRERRGSSSSTRVGREMDGQPRPQEVLKELLGLTPLSWKTLNTRQAASMRKMLPGEGHPEALRYVT